MPLLPSSSRPASVSFRSAIPSDPLVPDTIRSIHRRDTRIPGSSSSASTSTATPTGTLPTAMSSSPPLSAPRRMPGLGAETWRRLRATSRRTPILATQSVSSRATPSASDADEGTSAASGPLPRPPSLTIHSDPPTVPLVSYEADWFPPCPHGSTHEMDQTESKSALFTSPRQVSAPQTVQPSGIPSTTQRPTSTSGFGVSHPMDPTSSHDSHARTKPHPTHSNSGMTLVHSGSSFGLEIQPSSTSLSTRAASSLLCTPGSHGTRTTASEGSEKQDTTGVTGVDQSHNTSIKTSVPPGTTDLPIASDQGATSAQAQDDGHVPQHAWMRSPVAPTITLQPVGCDSTCEASALRAQLQALMEDNARLSRICAESATIILVFDGQLQQCQAQLAAANSNAEMWATMAKQAQKSALEDTLRSIPARLEQLLGNVGSYQPPATAPAASSHVPPPVLQPPRSASTMHAP